MGLIVQHDAVGEIDVLDVFLACNGRDEFAYEGFLIAAERVMKAEIADPFAIDLHDVPATATVAPVVLMQHKHFRHRREG